MPQKLLTTFCCFLPIQSPFDTGFLNIITPQNKRISALVGDIVFQASRRAFLRVVQTTQPTWSYVSRVFMDLPVLGSEFHLVSKQELYSGET